MISVTNLVMPVTMVTSVKKNVSAVFLIWMWNVTSGMDSVTVNPDIPRYTAIKPALGVRMDSSVRKNVFVKIIQLVIRHLAIAIVCQDFTESIARKLYRLL